MAKKIKADDLASFVMSELNSYVKGVPEDFEAAGKAAGKAAVDELKSTSPKKSGEYSRGWKAKTTKTRTGAETVIYQGAKPGLAHVLEYGHAVKSGGRVVGRAKAYPHIKRAEENATKVYEQEFKRRIEGGN